MAVRISNTLSDYFQQSMVLQTNYLETLAKLNDATKSDKDFVTLNITDPNNPDNIQTYQIPSFGYLKKSIDRIDRTMETILNIRDNSKSRVRLSDGSYRDIIVAGVAGAAKPVEHVEPVTKFDVRSNWFFENLLNPCLYVSLDITDEIDPKVERLCVQRFILSCDNVNKRNYFTDNFAGKSDIDYNEFVKRIHTDENGTHFDIDYDLGMKGDQSNMIDFIFDEDIRDLPPRNKRFSGEFTVLDISRASSDYAGNIRKVYTLDNITYTDMRGGNDTREIGYGDILESPESPSRARYKVVDIEGNKVTLELIEGINTINVNSKFLISSEAETRTKIDIPVGYDERQVVFIRPVDPVSNIPAEKWSPGVGFYTSDLHITYGDTEMSFRDFYRKYVVDFGQVILSYAKDYYPSIREGIKPDAPVLTEDNFVISPNGFIDSDGIDTYLSSKLELRNEIDTLNSDIVKIKDRLLFNSYTSDSERKKDMDDLTVKRSTRDAKVAEFTSVVCEMDEEFGSYMGGSVSSYTVYGLWNIPVPKRSPSTGEQEIIGFRIRYRYDMGDNIKIPILVDGGDYVEGVVSNWHEITTKIRERVFDEKSGTYVWKEIDVLDDSLKFNECKIPMPFGSHMEIQIKSISEAGWPANPLESDWSNLISIYPDSIDEEIQNNNMSALIQNKVDMLSNMEYLKMI